MTLNDLVISLNKDPASIFERNLEQYLKESNHTIEDKGKFQKTLLMQAAREGKLDILKVLLAKGAKTDEIDGVGKTALTHAIVGHCSGSNKHHYESIVNALLEAGANINHLDNCSFTPLMWASFHGNLKMMQLLVESGAEVNLVGERGISAIMSAVMNVTNSSASHTIDYLCVQGSNPNLKIKQDPSKKLASALSLAISQQDLDSVKTLIKHGAELPRQGKERVTVGFRYLLYRSLLNFRITIPKWAKPYNIESNDVAKHNASLNEKAKARGAEVGRNLLINESCCNIVKDYLYSYTCFRAIYQKAYNCQRALLNQQQSTSSNHASLVKKRQHPEGGSVGYLSSLALSRAKRKK